jgi:SHS2 domain-containing protein
MSFEELSHTADIRMRVKAPTLGLLFSDAFTALMLTLYGNDRKGADTRKLTVTAPDTETLLLDFLSEVLFIGEVDGMVFSHADVETDGRVLKAVLHGEPFDRKRHAEGTEVKGISYSGMAITRDTNGYMVDILFDV